MIIDAQVHAYERDRPDRPWTAVLPGPPEMTGAEMVKAMDDVGVDGAILVSPFTMYRYDASYALEVHAAHPNRFALVKPVDPSDPMVADTIAEWAKTPGAVAVRIMMTGSVSTDPSDPGLNRVLEAAGTHGLPVNLLCWGRIDTVDGLAERNPNTRLVIDHLGLHQPFAPPAPPDAFAAVPEVCTLARHDNVVVKITGACTLSSEPFPYPDLMPALTPFFEAFGLDRCLWGTDWTRATALLTFAEGVDAFRLTDHFSAAERAMLMGGTCEQVYGWAPGSRTL